LPTLDRLSRLASPVALLGLAARQALHLSFYARSPLTRLTDRAALDRVLGAKSRARGRFEKTFRQPRQSVDASLEVRATANLTTQWIFGGQMLRLSACA